MLMQTNQVWKQHSSCERCQFCFCQLWFDYTFLYPASIAKIIGTFSTKSWLQLHGSFRFSWIRSHFRCENVHVANSSSQNCCIRSERLSVNCWQMVTIYTVSKEDVRNGNAKLDASTMCEWKKNCTIPQYRYSIPIKMNHIVCAWTHGNSHSLNKTVLYVQNKAEHFALNALRHINTQYLRYSFVQDFISIVRHIHTFSWTTEMTKCKSYENMCHKHEFTSAALFRVPVPALAQPSSGAKWGAR